MDPCILKPIINKVNIQVAYFMLLFLLLSCQPGNNKKNGNKKEATKTMSHTAKDHFDACSILDKSIYSEALGEPVKEGKTLLSVGTKPGETRVSHCLFQAASGSNKFIGVLIRQDAVKNVNPTSREGYLTQSVNENDELENDVRDAILKGKELPGIGDVAFTYKLEGLGSTLMAFWQGHFMLQVTVNGITNEEAILKTQQKIAKEIIAAF